VFEIAIFRLLQFPDNDCGLLIIDEIYSLGELLTRYFIRYGKHLNVIHETHTVCIMPVHHNLNIIHHYTLITGLCSKQLIRNHTGLQVLHSYNTLINTETIKANKNNLFIKHIIELILPLIKCDLHYVSIKSLPFLAFCLSVVCLSVS